VDFASCVRAFCHEPGATTRVQILAQFSSEFQILFMQPADSQGLLPTEWFDLSKERVMQYRDDEEMYSLGSVAIADESDALDTASDSSEWVRQYTEWFEEIPTQEEPARSS
jgi:hypothetical protein